MFLTPLLSPSRDVKSKIRWGQASITKSQVRLKPLSLNGSAAYDRNLSHSYTKEHNEFEQQYDTQWSGKRYEEEKYITGISTEDQKSKGRPKNSALVAKGEDKMLMLLYMTLYTVKYDNG